MNGEPKNGVFSLSPWAAILAVVPILILFACYYLFGVPSSQVQKSPELSQQEVPQAIAQEEELEELIEQFHSSDYVDRQVAIRALQRRLRTAEPIEAALINSLLMTANENSEQVEKFVEEAMKPPKSEEPENEE